MPGFHVKWQVCTAADSGAPNRKLWLHWEHKQERQMEFRKMNVAGALERVIQIIEACKSYQAFRVHLMSYHSTRHTIHINSFNCLIPTVTTKV